MRQTKKELQFQQKKIKKNIYGRQTESSTHFTYFRAECKKKITTTKKRRKKRCYFKPIAIYIEMGVANLYQMSYLFAFLNSNACL